MALVYMGSLGGGNVVMYHDVVNDAVVGVRVENNASYSVLFSVSRPGGRVVGELTIPPGTVHVETLKKPQQFPFAAGGADWRIDMTPVV